jgi:uncharacterized membrane protein
VKDGEATMWPAMFGPGCIWGVVVAISVGCLLVGLVGFLLLAVDGHRHGPVDPLDELWHRYEEGDVTRQEFERLRREALERIRRAPGA